MRNTFAKHITELANKDPRIILMMGDIGNRMFDEFKSIANDKFINCGIAEANMMSMAAGLALSGMRPFVYTITPFVTLRCLEQIRISVAYHNAKVILVGLPSQRPAIYPLRVLNLLFRLIFLWLAICCNQSLH